MRTLYRLLVDFRSNFGWMWVGYRLSLQSTIDICALRCWYGFLYVTKIVVFHHRVVGEDFRALYRLSYDHNLGFSCVLGGKTTQLRETFLTVRQGRSITTFLSLGSTFVKG